MSQTSQISSPSLIATVREWTEMIKIEHTVFALPFALSGLILAVKGFPDFATVLWTVIAFAGARCAAMTLNRLIDAEIDARNPRTKERAIPAGRISKKQAWLLTLASFAVMILGASMLPRICLYLSPIAVAWLSLYSFTKRFTWMCHFVLGIALGGAALGGWVAAGGSLSAATPWYLALAVSTWVAGFDIIYALQDIEIDKEEKLFSIPSRFGTARALQISSGLHVLTVLGLLAVGLCSGLGFIYFGGVCVVAGILVYEHLLLKPNDLSKLNAAFFNMNGILSISTFCVILADHLVGHLL
jgi:4-hydroxybenzoate polyprenyltransferase